MEMFVQSPLNAKNKRVEALFRTLFMLMTLLLVLPVLIILGMLIIKGSPVISIDFLFTNPTDGMTAGGIFPALLGTVWLVTVALLVSVPLGIAAAIYLSEYAAENWFTRTINLAIINLAGVPSIVHALFGVGAFVIFFGFGTSILSASLTLAIMTLPVVIVASRESLQAVPHAFREACWNMGATRWQTIRKVVLPNAISGILTGIILFLLSCYHYYTAGFGIPQASVHRGLHMGVTLALVFFSFSAFGARRTEPGPLAPLGLPLIDWAMAIAGTAAALYVPWIYSELAFRVGNPLPIDILSSFISSHRSHDQASAEAKKDETEE